MKVPGQDPIRLLEYYLLGTQEAGKGAPAKRPETAGANPSDRVEISGKARDFQQLNQEISALPDVRVERVAALQAKIASGAYNIRGERVAEGLVRATFLDAIL